MKMNFVHHHGSATGDQSAQVEAACSMELSRCSDSFLDGSLGPIDAPEWVNVGRMVNVTRRDGNDVQFQQQTHRDCFAL